MATTKTQKRCKGKLPPRNARTGQFVKRKRTAKRPPREGPVAAAISAAYR